MASFEKRGTSTRVIVRLPGGGKLTQTFDTRREAEQWATEQERKKTLGQLKASSANRIFVSDVFEGYEHAVASKTDSAKWNKLRLSKWLLDPLSRMLLDLVTTHHINEWIERRQVDVTGSTVRRELNLMSAAFAWAVKTRKWIAVNPCHGALRPAANRVFQRPLLTADEIKAVCQATGYTSDPDLRTATARVGAVFLLGLETGMRSGEILRLRPEDYWRDAKTVYVAAIEPGGRKGAKSGRASVDPSRKVPLTARAAALLDQLMLRPGDRHIVGVSDQARDALWRKAVKQSGVENLRFHHSKHEAATRLAQHLDVIDLSHAIGTKDIRLLRDVYYTVDASRSAAKLPASLIGP